MATTYIIDAFTSASTVDLTTHTPNTGSSWTNYLHSSTWTANDSSSGYVLSSVASSSGNLIYIATPSVTLVANYSVQVDIVQRASGISAQPCGIIARATATDTFYAVYLVSNAASATFIVKNAGTATVLGSATGLTTTGTHTLKLVIRDNLKVAYYDAVQVGSSSNNDITAAGSPGIAWGTPLVNGNVNSSWHLDNFSVVGFDDNAITPPAQTGASFTGFAPTVSSGVTTQALIALATFTSRQVAAGFLAPVATVSKVQTTMSDTPVFTGVLQTKTTNQSKVTGNGTFTGVMATLGKSIAKLLMPGGVGLSSTPKSQAKMTMPGGVGLSAPLKTMTLSKPNGTWTGTISSRAATLVRAQVASTAQSAMTALASAQAKLKGVQTNVTALSARTLHGSKLATSSVCTAVLAVLTASKAKVTGGATSTAVLQSLVSTASKLKGGAGYVAILVGSAYNRTRSSLVGSFSVGVSALARSASSLKPNTVWTAVLSGLTSSKSAIKDNPTWTAVLNTINKTCSALAMPGGVGLSSKVNTQVKSPSSGTWTVVASALASSKGAMKGAATQVTALAARTVLQVKTLSPNNLLVAALQAIVKVQMRIATAAATTTALASKALAQVKVAPTATWTAVLLTKVNNQIKATGSGTWTGVLNTVAKAQASVKAPMSQVTALAGRVADQVKLTVSQTATTALLGLSSAKSRLVTSGFLAPLGSRVNSQVKAKVLTAASTALASVVSVQSKLRSVGSWAGVLASQAKSALIQRASPNSATALSGLSKTQATARTTNVWTAVLATRVGTLVQAKASGTWGAILQARTAIQSITHDLLQAAASFQALLGTGGAQTKGRASPTWTAVLNTLTQSQVKSGFAPTYPWPLALVGRITVDVFSVLTTPGATGDLLPKATDFMCNMGRMMNRR